MTTRFALRDSAVMAEFAGVKCIAVRERAGYICPRSRWNAVAIFADVTGIGMSAGFTCCRGAVVTTGTSSDYLIVIQWGNERQPGTWWYSVARLANISGIGMIAWFTGGNPAIVARYACAGYLVVIEWIGYQRQPGTRRHAVASVAHIGGRRMIAGLAGGNYIVVTTDATANDLRMIQRRDKRQPAIGRNPMTNIAIVRGIGMITRFTCRGRTVVTTGAGTYNLAVIHS